MFPVTYHKQLDRINVAQRALNAYSREVLQMMALSYPLLKTFTVPVLLHEVIVDRGHEALVVVEHLGGVHVEQVARLLLTKSDSQTGSLSPCNFFREAKRTWASFFRGY